MVIVVVDSSCDCCLLVAVAFKRIVEDECESMREGTNKQTAHNSTTAHNRKQQQQGKIEIERITDVLTKKSCR